MYRVFDSSILCISFWSSLYGVDVRFRHLDNSALFNVTYRALKDISNLFEQMASFCARSILLKAL